MSTCGRLRILLDTLAIFYRRYVLDTYRRDPRTSAWLGATGANRAAPPPAWAARPRGLLQRAHLRVLFLNWRDITNPEAGGAEVYTHEVGQEVGRAWSPGLAPDIGFPGWLLSGR